MNKPAIIIRRARKILRAKPIQMDIKAYADSLREKGWGNDKIDKELSLLKDTVEKAAVVRVNELGDVPDQVILNVMQLFIISARQLGMQAFIDKFISTQRPSAMSTLAAA